MAVSAEYIDQKDPEEDTLDWGEEVNVSGYTIKSNKSYSWTAVLGTNQSVILS
ncbi:hypothetical protein C7960_2056 [Methanohalophilus euhalobius]|jgi:hypothetical protein|uniref:Uncharacterized protein n=1 Tax=Methanohalophilus euhalobius TaxID=51203 RepID=A0A285EX50_9EURY|nr:MULTISPECIES: hypothetical protein [Methanohalophilus]TCL12781.1 hypothetical protein C7960_2056 [Methanohalophilus euhalobius]SNY03625.1 hypothetical protein SAMN06295989_102105 [Methanohalophilus euhalobius]